MAYELISYKYNGIECWTLLSSEDSTSPLYALIYSALKLRRRRSNTQRIHATALQQFYEYIQLKHQRTLESYIQDLGLWELINELVGFAVYLESGRKGVNLISLSGSENTQSTNSTRIRHVCMFLDYLNQRYTTRKYQPHISFERDLRQSFNTNKFLIIEKRKELANIASGGTNTLPEYYKSLTTLQLAAFKKVVYPHTAQKRNLFNPFASGAVSFRNYLVAILMLEYGLRRGEVCLLSTFSFKPNMEGTKYYIVVTNLDENEGSDPRSTEAAIKTQDSHRTLQISEEFYLLLCHYVENIRPEDSGSDFLFVAQSTGMPLSMRMINKFFQTGFTANLYQHFPEIADKDSLEYLSSCHPHRLRHTWAVAQLAYLCQVQKKTLSEAKDQLRILGGWSIKSTMPDHYGRRYLADSANAMNLKRILYGEK